MFGSLRSNLAVRSLAALYASTFLSGAWAMIIPTIPVLAQQFGVSAGGTAQSVTAFGLGKLVGTVIAGVVLDRMGTRRARRWSAARCRGQGNLGKVRSFVSCSAARHTRLEPNPMEGSRSLPNVRRDP
jgi:MFS family permease